MENKLDVLTRKLYEEGVNRANIEAEKIMKDAQDEAKRIINEAECNALEIEDKAKEAAQSLKKRVESELALTVRQAMTVLKQLITELVSGKIAKEMSHSCVEDKTFVWELLTEVVKRWNITSNNMDLEVLLPADKKKKFEEYISIKCKMLLDNGLEIKIGEQSEAFVLQPKDGSYKILFSDTLFESFFNQYIKGIAKELLYK